MPTYPGHVIDVHTHLFNAHALPIEEILKKGSIEGWKVPAWLAKLVAALINALTGADETAVGPALRAGEPPDLFEALRRLQLAEPADLEARLDAVGLALARMAAAEVARRHQPAYLASFVAADRPAARRDLSTALAADELLLALEGIESRYAAGRKAAVRPLGARIAGLTTARATAARVRPADRDAALVQLAAYVQQQTAKPLTWLVGKLYETAKGVVDKVVFVLVLLLKEERILDRLKAGYPGVHATFNHLMMDMEPAYKDAPRTPFAAQIQHMAGIMAGSGGQLGGFVAFDPRRKEALALVRTAIATQCFAGVKIYPGLGYTPNPADPVWQHLFDFVCNRGTGNGLGRPIPVLAHCTPAGWERTFEVTGLLSDPANWLPVLQAYPELRLCYGHAGGSGIPKRTKPPKSFLGWADAWGQTGPGIGGNYAETVLAHCLTYEHVCCDFSYHELLVVPSLRTPTHDVRIMEDNLVQALRAPGPYPFSQKMMYGTDFHMPTLVSRTQEYLDAWIGIIARVAAAASIDPAILSRLFFAENAQRFLA